MTERLLEAAELAERLAVPTSWVREQTRAGTLPHVRLGRYVRYELGPVEAWLEECRQPGRPITMRGGRP